MTHVLLKTAAAYPGMEARDIATFDFDGVPVDGTFPLDTVCKSVTGAAAYEEDFADGLFSTWSDFLAKGVGSAGHKVYEIL